MERSDTVSLLRSEIEYLKAQVQELRQSRDQAYHLLQGLERLAHQTLFWDGTPERLSALAAQIRQAFGYRAVSMVVSAPDAVCCRVVDPPDELPSFAPTPDTEPIWEGHEPGVLSIAGQARLLVPLVDDGRLVGRIEILLEDPPAQEWVGIWRALSIQLTEIITQGTRFAQIHETQRRQQLVYDITRHLSPDLSLEQMLSDVLELTIPYADADAGSIMLLDDGKKVVSHVLTRRHLPSQEQAQIVREVLERGLAGWILEYEEATIVTDTTTDRRWLHLPQDDTAFRSALSIPLRRGARISGLLFLVHRDVAHFTEGHLVFLSSVADQLAMSIENAYLLEQTRHRLDELALLNEISQAASSLQLNDVLRIVTQRIVQALRVRRCAVFLLDEQETHLVLRAVHNPDIANDDMNLVLALSARPHIAEAVRVRRPVEITDVLADERLRSFWEKARELDIGSQLAVPLIARQRVIGAISIDRSMASTTFTQSEIDLCQTIAHQAANAIENAQLYQEIQRRADLLGLVNKVSHDIGAILDTNVLLWEVVHLILETLHCYYVAVGLIEGDQLVFRAGINHMYQPTQRTRLPMLGEEKGIAIWVARTGRSLLVPDVLQDDRFKPLPGLPDARSELAVPLRLPGRMQRSTDGMHQVMGVLDVQSTLPGAFSVEDQSLLESLASQVAVAIESAVLFGQMREERAALEAILNGTDDAIIVTDPTDRILFFNPAAQHAFLDDERPLAGDSFAQVVKNEALLDLWGEPASKEANAAEIPMSDGRTFNASLTVIRGVGRVAVMQDITHLKEMDKVKSEFVSTVSHDLRSPLQVIQTSAELLPRMGELNLEQHKEVDHILAVVRRMADLVQNLLDIGRIEAGIGMEVEPCAIDEIIAAVAGSFRTLAQSRHLDLTVDLPKTLPLVYGNRLRLEQVVSNLLQNAIKFTPEGTVSVVAWSENGEVIVEVNDTGIGIPPEAHDALFQKFYRVNSPLTRGIQGTGLGLAIVKSIVENYRGKIEVESTPRLGSTFRVTFPVYGEERRLTSEHLPYENSQHQAADR